MFVVSITQATDKLAGELKAYYNRLQPVVGDGFTPNLEFVELTVVERQKYGLRKKKNLEDFLHATVNGIDEIYRKSYPVQYCQILKLEDGPTSGKHIIISGAPGSGKTTLVRQLCKDLSSGRLSNDYSMVVLVELRELILILQDKEEAQLHHFLTKFRHRVDIDQVCSELEECHGRSMLLVLDGFDELDVRMRRCQLLRYLLSTESNYLPECDIIVTSRPVTCPDLLGLMKPLHHHIEVLGFSEKQIASFVKNYLKPPSQPPSAQAQTVQPPSSQLPTQPPPTQPPPTQPLPTQPLPTQPLPTQPSPAQPPPSQSHEGCEAEKLLSRLDQLPQVKGMCRTPVVLKIVCIVCQLLSADKLPATMTGIYEKFILRQLLENGPEDAEISSVLHIPSSNYPFFNELCEIAFECCTNQKLTISRLDLGDTLPPLVRGSIYGLLYADPVIDLQAVRELVLYHFMHKTVQEALAACHVAVLPNPESHMKVWKKWFGVPKMAEVWKFYCGLTKLKYKEVFSVVQLADEVSEGSRLVRDLLVISLFEAGNVSLAREELPRIFPSELHVQLSTSYETAVYAYALQHHPSLERLRLAVGGDNVNLQLLLDALSRHLTVRELHVDGHQSVVASKGECADIRRYMT